MRLDNKVYDILKWVSLIALPALASFVGGLTKIWVIPYGPEIVLTVNLVAVFLGALIGVSTINYNKEDK